MSPRAARAVVLAVLALVLGPLLVGAPALVPPVLAPATAAAQQPLEPESPVDVLVTTLTPRAPEPGGTLRLAGRLRNTGSSPIRDLRVRLRLGGRLDSRSGVAAAEVAGAATDAVPATDVEVADLPAGAATAFALSAAIDRLPLGRDGVYPLEVEVRGRVDGSGRSERVGLASTFLPWFAEPPTGVTRLAWLWPLVDQPRQAPRPTAQGMLLLDDVLAEELGEGGRLAGMLRAARAAESPACPEPPPVPDAAEPPPTPPTCPDAVPVTYAVDPDLLATVEGMARGYRVRVSGSRTRPGTGQDEAAAWLASLREALDTSDLLALPYADADIRSLTAPASDLAEDAGLAIHEGTETAAALTGEEPLDGVAWTPPGPVTEGALDAYALTGARALIVQEAALPSRPADLTRTPGTRTTLRTASGRTTGLVIDAGLSRLLEPTGPWQGARLAEQRWLVETAIIAAEAPRDTRTLLVAPPRRADVVPAVAAQAMLDSLRVPWLCPVPLADVVRGTEQCPGGDASPSSPAEDRGVPLPLPEDPPRLPALLLAALAATREDVDQLTLDVLARSDEVAATRTRLLRGAFRAESTAWRERGRRGRVLAGLLADDVTDLLGRIKVLTGPVTLTGSAGRLTVDVQNLLDQAVTVRVRVAAPSQARLGTVVTDVVRIPGRTSVPVPVPVEPRTSGQFPVAAQLLDRDRDPFGARSEFVLRSTRYGTVALAVTGLGAALLLVSTGVRLARRGLGR